MVILNNNNYRIGRIYKIIHNQSDIIYIGSTFSSLNTRFYDHKRHFKDENTKTNCSIYKYFEQYGTNQFKMILIKEYECVDRQHLYSKEQLWIKKLKCINERNAFNPIKNRLYREINKEKLLKYAKNYREENKEKIKNNMVKYYETNKEKLLKQVKQYREDNIDKYKEKDKNYYKNNKETILQKMKQTYICEYCNKELNLNHKLRHESSKKHLDNFNKQNLVKQIIVKKKYICLLCNSEMNYDNKNRHEKSKIHLKNLK